MVELTIPIIASLEMSSAALFVQAANKYKSDIRVKIENKSANAKSIMSIMSLSILDGQNVTVTADGGDEQQAVTELSNYLKSL
jgi:catabolite repression HPr-like protein